MATLLLMFVMVACGGGAAEQTVESPSAAAQGDNVPGVKGAAAAFIRPRAGDKVSSPVPLKMTAAKVKIEEAGVIRKGAGHFHVMIDAKCVANGTVIPEDAKHVHYGDASTSAKLKLEPGKHTLCLQLGNGAHKAFGRTDTVNVTVK